jgi:L-seryl-tRNA(Ser) seleniumtransferase
MLDVPARDLSSRAERIIALLEGLPLVARQGTGRAQIGGGTLPRSAMPSITLDLTHRTLSAQDLVGRLRVQPIPVIGYIVRGIVKLDLRTIFPRQDGDVVNALRAVSA